MKRTLATLISVMILASLVSFACAGDTPVAPNDKTTAALDAVLADTLATLATGDGAKIAKLLSAQSNELLMPTKSGFVAIGTEKLKKTPASGADFKIAAGWKVKDRKYTMLGAITVVDATVSLEGKPDRLLSGALVEEGGSYRYLALAMLQPQPDKDPNTLATTDEISRILNSWSAGFPKGDISALEEKLYPDPFSIGVTGPGNELFAFGYPDYFIGTVNSFLAMGAADYSSLEGLQIRVDGSVAVAQANWDLSLAQLGQIKGRIEAHFCKTPKGWRLIGMVGGSGGR